MDLDAIGASGGLAQINHPNFFWQLTADDIASTKGGTFMEIANMQPDVNSAGAGPDAPSSRRYLGSSALARQGDLGHRLRRRTRFQRQDAA